MALIGREDVDDHGTQINENPAAVSVSLSPRDGEPVDPHGLCDRVRDRARLDLRAARHDDERVGDDRSALEIDNRDVLTFFIFGSGADGGQEIRQCEPFRNKPRRAGQFGAAGLGLKILSRLPRSNRLRTRPGGRAVSRHKASGKGEAPDTSTVSRRFPEILAPGMTAKNFCAASVCGAMAIWRLRK